MAVLALVVLGVALTNQVLGATEALQNFEDGNFEWHDRNRSVSTGSTELVSNVSSFLDVFRRANSLNSLFDDSSGPMDHEEHTETSTEARFLAFTVMHRLPYGVRRQGLPRLHRYGPDHDHELMLRRSMGRRGRRRVANVASRTRGVHTTRRSLVSTQHKLMVQRSKVHGRDTAGPRYIIPKTPPPRMELQFSRTTDATVSSHRRLSSGDFRRLASNKKSHLRLSNMFLKRRLGNYTSMEAFMAGAFTKTMLLTTNVKAAFLKATIYKTPVQNNSLELFCLVSYRTAASIVWRVGDRAPEDFVTVEVAYAEKESLKVMSSRLWVPRLEALPTPTTFLTFRCIAKADGSDSRSSIEVPALFTDACGDSSDCEPRNAVCAFGRCECIDFMPVSLSSTHVTCRAYGYIGWPCHYDEQCMYAVKDSVCNVYGKCGCNTGYRYGPSKTSCVPKSSLGAECRDHSECRGESSVCRKGHCGCPDAMSAWNGTCHRVVPIQTIIKKIDDRMEKDGNDTGDARSSVNITGALGTVGLQPAHARSAALCLQCVPDGVRGMIALLIWMLK